MKHILLFATALLALLGNASAQNCKPFNYSMYDSWRELSAVTVSNNGAYVFWEWNPQKGDGSLILFHTTTRHYDTLPRAAAAAFFPNGSGLVFRIKPPLDSLRKQQLAGIKKEKQLKDSLGVWFFDRDTILRFPQVKSYQIAKEQGSLLALLHEPGWKMPKKDSTEADSLKPKKSAGKEKGKKEPKTAIMQLINLSNAMVQHFENVAEASISETMDALAFVVQRTDSLDSCFVYRYHPQADTQLIFHAPGQVIQTNFDQTGRQLAFLYSADTAKRKLYQLGYAAQKDQRARIVIDTLSPWLPAGWHCSEHEQPSFSEDGTALYLGIAPKPETRVKDTLTEDEKVSLDIWHWRDGRLQTQQLKEKENDLKKRFLAVWYPRTNSFVQLADSAVDEVRPDKKLHRRLLLASDDKRWELLRTREQKRYVDVYVVDRITGSRQLLLEKHHGFYTLSPEATHLLYYQPADSNWYSLSLSTLNATALTKTINDVFYDVENDLPMVASAYGFAGWLDASNAVVYSKNHLWALNLTGKIAPRRLTSPANNDQVSFRWLQLDKEAFFLPDTLFLSAFDEQTKSAGFARLSLQNNAIQFLTASDAWYSSLIKAKNAPIFVFRKENHAVFPDLYVTTEGFNTVGRISDANPQQKNYCSGTVKLVSWRSFAGDSLQGLLYYPAGFSADSSYPMITYFYETHSDNLMRYFGPRPSRSTINISEYTSRGYFVFTPDIRYREGQPGQSAYDAIVSGVQSMLERERAINPLKLGLQGQSWGGYQTAWLVTRTGMFRAAMAGAPVSNMTSAYGGIRWESGVSRTFQYEEGQSRIGASLWENLPAYIENSPLFYADKVTTPLLIMSNDADGAVPWYQGIEFFNALRRLEKPVWMLVYNNAPHNLSRRADAMDLTRRLQQFFDHYLKDAPAPMWMTKGLPAVKKGKTMGFEIN